jgi:hypothetical protein
MKKTIYPAIIIMVMGSGLLIACTKDIKDTTPLVPNFNQLATVQLYNATLNTTRNFVYVNGSPILATPLVYTQTTATNATHTGSGVVYALKPGTMNFLIKDTAAAATQPEFLFANDFQANRFYSVFTYDSVNSMKQVTVPTTITIPDTGTARVRFTNLSYLKGSVPPAVDIYSKNQNANIFSNISLAQVTDFINFPARGSDSLIVRQTGTMTALDTATFNPTQKRSYTLVFRGRYSTNEAGGALFPRLLTSFVNY